MFCPVCNSLAIETHSVDAPSAIAYTQDAGKKRDRMIARCGSCWSRFSPSVATVDFIEDANAQALVNYEYYKPNFSREKFEEQLSINKAMLSCFARFFRKRRVYVELGVGLGMLTRAASEYFDIAHGLDLEIEVAETSGPCSENVSFIKHDAFVSSFVGEIDALGAWHVVEHLADPHVALRPFLSLLSSNGVFFGQVPLYKPEYVIESHFVFYTEHTLIKLLSAYGMCPVYLERDEVNSFLSFCFRMQ